MNLRRRRQGSASTKLTAPRAILIWLLTACAAMALAAPDAMSADGSATRSNPAAPLWQNYPLEQSATTVARSPGPPTRSTAPASERSAPDPGGQTPWIVFLLVGIALALTAATAVVLRRKSA